MTDADADRAFAGLPEMHPGPVCRLGLDGTVELANAAARDLFGGPVAGRRWAEVSPGMPGEAWTRALGGARGTSYEEKVGDRCLVFVLARAPGSAQVFIYGSDVTALRNAERALREGERMATLGTLTAGVAHELNNPAAAARRAATHLREQFAALQRLEIEIGALSLPEDARAAMRGLTERTHQWAAQTGEFNALARNDQEDVVERWMTARGVSDPWEIAGALVELGYGVDELAALEGRFPGDHLAPILRWLAASFEVNRLFDEVERSTARLSEIVGALKAYSYVGQAPRQAVDVNEGIRNTLIILRNKLKQGMTVIQQLTEGLPRIQAYGGDLNQVWTNLIDNAVAATGGTGTITLRSFAGPAGGVVVEVEDNGPGIPDEHKARIFDAFFTTKPPGQGTGLGLYTCHNIVVKKHQGAIDVTSEPGRTTFTVRLPAACPDDPGGA